MRAYDRAKANWEYHQKWDNVLIGLGLDLQVDGFISIGETFLSLFRPYQSDPKLEKGNFWQKSATVVPILDIPANLFKGILALLVCAALAVVTIATTLYIAYICLRTALFSPVEAKNAKEAFVEFAIQRPLIALFAPCIVFIGITAAIGLIMPAAVAVVGQGLASVADIPLTFVSLVMRPVISLVKAIIDGPIAKFRRWLSNRQQAKQVDEEPKDEAKNDHAAQLGKKNAKKEDNEVKPAKGPLFKPAALARDDKDQQPWLPQDDVAAPPVVRARAVSV